jgi:hypothetical protein
MSELIDPVVDLNFYQITNRGSRLSEEAKQFSEFLQMYIAEFKRAFRGKPHNEK